MPGGTVATLFLPRLIGSVTGKTLLNATTACKEYTTFEFKLEQSLPLRDGFIEVRFESAAPHTDLSVASLSRCFLPSREGISLGCRGGPATLSSLKVFDVNSAWK